MIGSHTVAKTISISQTKKSSLTEVSKERSTQPSLFFATIKNYPIE
jgi:hypothetical protein